MFWHLLWWVQAEVIVHGWSWRFVSSWAWDCKYSLFLSQSSSWLWIISSARNYLLRSSTCWLLIYLLQRKKKIIGQQKREDLEREVCKSIMLFIYWLMALAQIMRIGRFHWRADMKGKKTKVALYHVGDFEILIKDVNKQFFVHPC